ncbi:DUF4783 domain-containing protein [Bacteroides sp. 51]|uniref:DUF4783 domain-containing protein n=1 Tax=Bacteroides sp. 51 TaxID=2302938 RepID=UPI0013D251F2|nr:DUF4783 domain-containing protein [Bacteroides sp. 51]NDV81897.1 DUF4783 domain-containing protein [Bacteroides sp. 51]
MKKRILLLTISVILTATAAMAQDVPEGVIMAFKRGSSVELGKFLSNNVELVIMNRTSNANKQTAETTMNSFFTQNKVTNFNVNHQGKKGESSFVIGTLSTSTGNYRVNCFLKRIENNYLIHQIRIDKTNE